MSTTAQSKQISAANIAAAAPASDASSQVSLGVKNLWQHPFVDVFKHFKIIPVSDWKQNKKQGDVEEIFAKEIGRKAINLNGSISANNFIQIPHPQSAIKTLGLSGRYLYLQAKAPLSSSPFSFHFDLQLAERSHGIRISASNLYKTLTTQNGFVLQVPLNLDMNRWTVAVFDIYELLKVSGLLPGNYQIEGSYQIRNITLCACSVVRGIFTSENLYDFVTLPPDLRFKFSFDISKWPEQFAWLELPQDLKLNATEFELAQQRTDQLKAKAALKGQNQTTGLTDRQKEKMEAEINEMLDAKRNGKPVEASKGPEKSNKLQALQEQMMKYQAGNDELLSPDEQLGFGSKNQLVNHESSVGTRTGAGMPYSTGQFIGQDLRRSPKLNLDPVMELKHVIGYSPDKCLNIKWSRIAGENVVIFSSGGTLIVMDVETNEQKRFFFGHSAPICCFDVASHGGLIASAQEGKNSIIRIWDYFTARCLSMVTMPVTSLKCVAFSPDGRYLASVGKDTHNKEMIIVWDISKITRGEKPEIAAKQTSDFNILCLKFSPIDNFRLVSCGKENIRFWRVKETNNIRGSAVVLNHHARNTVFTSFDFEWGARASSSAINPSSKENESLKRVFVASKHGMVFQINYATEALEATFRTNDSAIYSISVNEAFCVTGSDDQFLRVWPLDFSEFFMEAKHEGTVCATDISSDGLRVVCGTLYGSLGILDKSNQRYRTLIRSHTNSILSMDFHVPKRNIITVSSDSTIRLWDIQNFDQVVEFSSPIDQPLCVAAHPTLPIFSCGFQSGTMRVFDIEKTCVADEFTQFNKPIRKICYSRNGEILVTCCEDGSVSIHNARRQHLPTKMMHLEFPPQFVHVAFSQLIRKMTQRDFSNDDDEIQSLQNELNDEEQESGNNSHNDFAGTQVTFESLFGLIGEYGNNLMIYDTNSILLKNQIQAGHILRSFQFSQSSSEIILITADQRIRFYSLARFEGVFLRELTTVHRGSVNTTDLSLNGGFMLTGGEDNLIKIWDYEAQKSVPFFFQAFIGHTYPISNVMFNPCDNNTVISSADKDGIYIWQFHGDTQTNYLPEVEDDATVIPTIDRNLLHQPTTLERMRMAVKEKKKPKLAEFSFIVPAFEPAEQLDHSLQTLGAGVIDQEDPNSLQSYYANKAKEKELNFNHFISVKEKKDFDIEIEKKSLFADASEGRVIESSIINGYDGFSGAHDNLLWNANQGTIVYTLNNKVIKENTKTRQQSVFSDSTVRISCIAQTENGKIVAAAEGETNNSGNSYIYLYDMEGHKLINKLTFHQKGVQALAFADKGRVLISLGVSEENALAVWDISQGLVLKSALIPGHATNQIIVDKSELDTIQFCTVGSKGLFTFWRVCPETGDLQFSEVTLPESLKDTDFVCANFTQIMPQPIGRSLLLLGSSDGAIVAFNPETQDFLEFGNKKYIMAGQIGSISAKNNSVVLSSNTGMIVKYPIVHGNIYPPEETGQITSLKAESSITSLVMDDLNVEGILGTSLGNIYYLNLQEQVLIKLVSRVCPIMDSIKVVRYDPTNQQVFLTTCGEKSGEVKLYTSMTIDQVMSFPQYSLGPVSFICASAKNRRLRMIGHQRGILKLVAVDSLKVEAMYQIDLQEGEQLTTGIYSPSGLNFAIGTSFGTVYLGNFKKDNYGRNIMRLARLSNLSKTQDSAVTSIQLSSFDPIGCLLVAFDNGQVRTWQSSLRNEQFLKLMETQKIKKGKKSTPFDIAELGQVQFDIIDKFDMFQNPHGLESITEDDQNQLLELYGDKKYAECEALFAPGSSCVDHYFCYVSALQYLFVRNYVAKQTIRRVSLMFFPTSLQLVDYYKLATELDLPIRGGGLQALCGVGTKEGKVLVYRVDSQETKLLSKTKGGLIFGAVTSLSIMDNGTQMVVASESGEILSFDLISTIKDRQEQV